MWRILQGSVQGKEKRDNQDSLFTRELGTPGGERILFAGLADGITQCPFGGAVARWVCQHMARCPIRIDRPSDVKTEVMQSIRAARATFRRDLGEADDFAQSGCTLTVAAIAEGVFNGFWVGDSPVLLSAEVGDEFCTECITSPDHGPNGELLDHFGATSPLNIKHIARHLHVGDVVTLATDGFTRIWDPGSLSSVYSAGLFDEGLKRQLLRLPFKDDATFIAIRIQI